MLGEPLRADRRNLQFVLKRRPLSISINIFIYLFILALLNFNAPALFMHGSKLIIICYLLFAREIFQHFRPCKSIFCFMKMQSLTVCKHECRFSYSFLNVHMFAFNSCLWHYITSTKVKATISHWGIMIDQIFHNIYTK